METNLLALLSTRPEEQQHNQFRALCLKKSMDKLKKLQQRVAGNQKPQLLRRADRAQDWFGYKN